MCARQSCISVQIPLRITGDNGSGLLVKKARLLLMINLLIFIISHVLCLLFSLATRNLKMIPKNDTRFIVGISTHQLYPLFYLIVYLYFLNFLIYLELRNGRATKVINMYTQASIVLDHMLNWLELPAPSLSAT